MKYVATLVLLIGTMAGQDAVVHLETGLQPGCQGCTINTISPVSNKITATELTQCEKDELQKAEQAVSDLKEKILTAHGKDYSWFWQSSYSFHCGVNYPYKTYDLFEDSFVIETQKEYTPICSNSVTIRGINK